MTNDTNKTNLTLTLPTGLRSFAEYRAAALGFAAGQLKCNPSDIDIEFPRKVVAPRQIIVTVRPVGTTVTHQVKLAKALHQLRWIAAGLGVMIFMVAAWQRQVLSAEQQKLQFGTDKAVQELVALKKESLKPTIEPQLLANTKAKLHVQQDANRWFAAVEYLKIPQVRLKQWIADTSNQTLQVTYDITDSAIAPQVTEALNDADTVFVWTLKTISERQAVWQGVINK